MKPFYLVNISSRSVLLGTSDVALGVIAIDRLLTDSGGKLPSVSFAYARVDSPFAGLARLAS
jgi:hypothetical protein